MNSEKKPETTASQPAVTSGGFRGRLARRRNKTIVGIVALATLLLLVFAGFVIYSQLHPTAKEVAVTDTGLTNDYRSMTLTELEAALNVRTDLTLNDIKVKTMTDGLLKNYTQAYIVAMALTNPNIAQYKKALDAYAIADAFAKQKAPESFYNDYADTALMAHNENTWTKQMANAKSAVERDTSLTASQKQTELTRLDGAIKAHQMGY